MKLENLYQAGDEIRFIFSSSESFMAGEYLTLETLYALQAEAYPV